LSDDSAYFASDIRLYTSSGELLRRMTASSFGEITQTISVADTYTLLIGDDNGTETANYQVYLQGSINPGNPIHIYSGQTITTTISARLEMDTYTFEAEAEDLINLRVERLSGEMEPEIWLFSPDGSLQHKTWGEPAVEIIEWVAPLAGKYTFLVGDHGGTETGTYRLTFAISGLQSLTLDQPFTATIHNFESQVYALMLPAGGESLLVEVLPIRGIDVVWVSGRSRDLPATGQYDLRTTTPTARGTYELLISPTTQGIYYISVFGRDIASPAGSYRITARLVEHYLSDITPRTAGNAGEITISLSGLGFSEGMQVALYQTGNSAAIADQVTFVSPKTLWAHFDLVGAAAGIYDLRVTWPDSTFETLNGAFTVTAGIGPRLEAHIEVPPIIRNLTPSVLWVEYANTGDADLPAPLLLVSNKGTAELRLSTSDPYITGTLQFLGINFDGPAGVLPPGASYRIPVYFRTDAGPHEMIEFVLEEMIADSTPIDWAAIEPEVRPANISDELWASVWDNFKAQVGDTWADYLQMMDENATYLSSLLNPPYDVLILLRLEMDRASAAYLRQTLAWSLDAYSPARGLPLVFSRVAYDTLDQRFTVGPFGRSWSHNFEFTLTNPEDGKMIIQGPGGTARVFTRDLTGDWQAQAGDFGTLTEQGGRFLLQEKDGLAWSFDAANGRLLYLEDPNGNRITCAYNGQGRLASLAHSNGQSFTLGYNAAGRISQLTDHAGRVTTYNYDGLGQTLLSVVAPGAVTTQYTYRPLITDSKVSYALDTVTFPNGTHQYFSYDANGRLDEQWGDDNVGFLSFTYGDQDEILIQNAAGDTVRVDLGGNGQVLNVSDPLDRRSRFVYDDDANLTRLARPDDASYQMTYDSNGNPTRIQDPAGESIDMAATTDLSRLDWLNDPKDRLTDFTYDAAGNLTAITYPDGSQESFTYDIFGNLTGYTNRRGQMISLSFNSLGQITRKAYPGGRTIDYTYDAVGRLLTADDSQTGQISMQYDPRGFLARIDYPGGRWFIFEYNNYGQRTRRSGHDGFVLNYHYDTAGRLFRMSDGSGAEFIRYTYDSAGRLAREDKGNGTYTTYAYDAAGQLLSLVNYAPDGAVQSRFDYTYDLNGNRTSMTTLDGRTDYSYDTLGQLTGVTYPDGRQVTYAYDAAGNRTVVTDDGVVTSYATNSLNQYTQVGGTSYTYDLDGNMTSETDASGTTTYQYDAENRLVSVTKPDGEYWQYTYDALGNRIEVNHNSATTYYVYDPTRIVHVAAEYNSSGTLDARFVYGQGLLERLESDASPAYYSFDGTGSTRQLTDAYGAIANEYDTDPFGRTLWANETMPNPYRFVGRFGVSDDSNGILSMYARYYNSDLGRYLSVDPLKFAGSGINLYWYVHNSPVTFIDPFGSETRDPVDTLDDYFTDGSPRWADPWTPDSIINGFGLCYGANRDCGSLYLTDEEVRMLDYCQRAAYWHDRALHQLNVNYGLTYLDIADPRVAGVHLEFIRVIQSWGNRCPLSEPSASPTLPSQEIAQGQGDNRTSNDPNEKNSTLGIGVNYVILPGQNIQYMISFENMITATAPAQQVVVIDQLDPNLDWSTFRASEIAFGDQVLALTDLPGGYYARAVIPDYRAESNQSWWVDIELDIDYQSGEVIWTFTTLDPLTGQFPTDPLAGFLPPEDGTGRGQGHVSFAIKPEDDILLGKVVYNQASITFDYNDPILTNQVWNTIDYLKIFLPVVRKQASN
jgi:RHS repeat-associated protein/uncharacterized repeat protein (TIGR01451 family)